MMPVNNATNLAEVVASKSLNGTSLVYHNLTALGAASARVTQVLDATLWPIIKSPYLTLFFIYQPKGDVTVIEVKSCKGSFGSYTSMSGYVTQTRSGFYYYRNGTVETAQKIPGLSISGCEAAGF